MTEVRTIRPGFLVSLKTSITGNVQTEREILQPRHETDEGYVVEEARVKHTIVDPKEQEAAIKLRGKARALVTRICTASAFGLLCPLSRKEELQAAIDEARALTWEFNRTAKTTQVRVGVIYGQIAQDDYEAVQAISGELRDLMADMADGIKNLDIKKVRDAAQRANDTGQMLSVDAKLRVDEAVKAARKAARKISKAGEAAAVELTQEALKKLAGARTSFLDLGEEEYQQQEGDDMEQALNAAAAPAAEFDFSAWDEEPADEITMTVDAQKLADAVDELDQRRAEAAMPAPAAEIADDFVFDSEEV